jgi:large subunit ribosomal protein L3
MNKFPGVIGRKIGMTQLFTDDGSVVPCTVIQARPVVVAKRTQEKDGYDALVVGLEERKEKHTTKPQAGFYKKQNVTPKRILKELRGSAEWVASFDIGAELKVGDIFSVGQKVDVQGTTRGRGFTGVMRRHNFKGMKRTHGTHEYKRHGGAIGTNMTPGRTLPGMGMPGQYGNQTVSVLSQKIVKIVAEEGLVLVEGGVPGSKNSLVIVRGAIKARGGKPKG